jgi:alpha-D-ribose 1-methylphosphonate 5-triphosphate synthase subunit PhnH
MVRTQTIGQHRVFRALMEVMSRPGTVQAIPEHPASREAGLEAVCHCLLDSESSLAGLGLEMTEIVKQIAASTRCGVAQPDQADFVLHEGSSTEGRLRDLRTGTPDWPDASATVLWLVDELHPLGGANAWKGPGIQDFVCPRIHGVDDAQWDEIRLINSSYPLGIDLVFIDRNCQIMALPRSTRISGMPE